MNNQSSVSNTLEDEKFKELSVDLERDIFLRSLIRELAGTLEEVIGLEEASGYISVVGRRIGHLLNSQYLEALNLSSLDKNQVANTLQDLKRRINGDFYITHLDEDKVVFRNRTCPFGDKVIGRPSLCMMTSNVFGTIAAENVSYAKVDVNSSIAQGDKECEVVVYFRESPESDAANGREYFGKD